MSYHREWDRGKDDSYQTGSLRDREEDYYNDSKRRKFNNGVRLFFLSTLHTSSPVSQTHDGSHTYDDNLYNNRHQDWSQDFAQDDRSRGGGGGFVKKRLVPSEPSPHVIFLGLDPDFTEADVCRLPCS